MRYKPYRRFLQQLIRYDALSKIREYPLTMAKPRYPATIQIGLPKEPESGKAPAKGLAPPHIFQERLPFGKVYAARGFFGYCSKQEIQYPDWIIGKLQFRINEGAVLTLNTTRPMVGMLCMLEGDMDLNTENGTSLQLVKGEFGFVYLPPKVNYNISFTKGHYQALYISFSSAFFASFIGQHAGFKDIYHKQLGCFEDSACLPFLPYINGADMVEKMRSCPSTIPAKKMFLHNVVNEILLRYFKGLELLKGQPAETYNKDEEKLRQVADYINRKFNKPLTVDVLAGMATMNITSFERKFKKLYGTTPKEYLLSCRMREAARLLKDSSLSAGEIGYQVGFTTARHFSEMFKKYFKCSPLQYRNNASEENRKLAS